MDLGEYLERLETGELEHKPTIIKTRLVSWGYEPIIRCLLLLGLKNKRLSLTLADENSEPQEFLHYDGAFVMSPLWDIVEEKYKDLDKYVGKEIEFEVTSYQVCYRMHYFADRANGIKLKL